MHIPLSLSLHFYLLCLYLNGIVGNDAFVVAFYHHSMLVKQSSSFSRKHRILSPDLCPPNSPVDPETRLTTEFDDWCRNVCKLYKTHVRDTRDLMQRINDRWASISQNVEAVGQWKSPSSSCSSGWRLLTAIIRIGDIRRLILTGSPSKCGHWIATICCCTMPSNVARSTLQGGNVTTHQTCV